MTQKIINHLSEVNPIESIAQTAFGPASTTDQTGQHVASLDALNAKVSAEVLESMGEHKSFSELDHAAGNDRRAYESLVSLLASQVEKPERTTAEEVAEWDRAEGLAEEATGYTHSSVLATIGAALEAVGYQYYYDDTCNDWGYIMGDPASYGINY